MKELHNTLVFIILGIVCIVSFTLNFYNTNVAPPCFNADEAAFGYNAYSILKTGKDEYGQFLPLRLKSFGDFKMPLYSYASVPFIALFGLNELSTRALNVFLSIFFPILVYFFTQELFKNKRISLISAFFVSVSLGLHVVGRHAHEAYIAVFLTTATALFFVKSLYNHDLKYKVFTAVCLLLSLFAYQSSRIFAAYFLISLIVFYIWNKKQKKSLIFFLLLVIGLFAITDIIYKPTRVSNLFFFNNPGFQLKIDELRTEGGLRYLYYPIFIGFNHIFTEHLKYFSPQFLAINGDENYRFGYPGMSPLNPIEYLSMFVGLYYLFKDKEKWRWFISGLIVLAPLSASLSWNLNSITRSLFLFIPVHIVAAYGIYSLLIAIPKASKRLLYATTFLLSALYLFFFIFQWDFYLFHYGKRAIVVRAWQCGYREIGQYLKDNYSKYNKIYISRTNGESYIFALFYLGFPPEKYQKEADLSGPNKYGFGQIDRFDKFEFTFPSPLKTPPGTLVIGTPEDFKSLPSEEQIDETKKRLIKVRTEDMFWIYEH